MAMEPDQASETAPAAPAADATSTPENMLLIRLGATAGPLGAIVLAAATAIHPMAKDPGNRLATYKAYAASDYWVALHIAQFIGMALLLLALHALTETLREGWSGRLARLGRIAAFATIVAATFLQTTDLIPLKVVLDQWAAAPGGAAQASALRSVNDVYWVGRQLTGATALLFGLTVALYAAALLSSPRYPQWLGLFAALAAAATLAAGLATFKMRLSLGLVIYSSLGYLVALAWLAVASELMWRRARPQRPSPPAPDPAAEPEPQPESEP